MIKHQEDFFSGPYVDSLCTCNVPRAYAHHPSKFNRDQINRLDTVHPRDQLQADSGATGNVDSNMITLHTEGSIVGAVKRLASEERNQCR